MLILLNKGMSEEQRGPTPAVARASPEALQYGTLYPYINMKSSGLTPYLNSFKRLIAPFNPWATPQFSTTHNVA